MGKTGGWGSLIVGTPQNDGGTPLWHVKVSVPITIWEGGATVIPRRGTPHGILGRGTPLGTLGVHACVAISV